MIVITLTKVPQSLRGDLTKWYQEVQTGVYVGNVSARVRDLLWERIVKNIGTGEATMVYNTNNELGYQIQTTRKEYAVVDFDGIPLMMRLNVPTGSVKHGFSNAAKFHKAKVMSRLAKHPRNKSASQIVSVDLETTGLNVSTDKIISIGAVKKVNGDEYAQFSKLIRLDSAVPESITSLTGISSEQLNAQGVDLKVALQELRDFVGNAKIVGYNLKFDEEFLSFNFKRMRLPDLSNEMLDLMPVIKKTNKFLDNYRLETVLKEYEIENSKPHHSLSDAKATLELANKLMKNGALPI